MWDPEFIQDIVECTFRRWSLQVGDPTLMAWIIVAAYLLTAAFSMIAVGSASTRRERWFWIFAGLFMLAMAVNKQLDLQSAVTAVGRCVAQLQGWYSERRSARQKFIFVLLAILG